MVRALVATMLQVARGKINIGEFQSVMKQKIVLKLVLRYRRMDYFW